MNVSRRLVELLPPETASRRMSGGLEEEMQRAVQATARFYADSNAENTTRLDKALSEVIRAVSAVDPAARISLKDVALLELLNYMPLLLSASTTGAATRSKLLRLLFQIAQYNVPLRRHFGGPLELCGPVFECLKLSLKEQLGPQNMIDILRLLQVLTYERTFTMGVWTNELVSFLLAELSREEEMEWLPYSIAILCNLASRSKTLAQRIKKSSSYKTFARRLAKLLQHDSRIVVVCSLVLIGYLDEKLRELVFCSQNIAQTFQCVFNVLILGDTLMTRHIAADLLRRLVVAETPSVSSTPTLSSTGKDLINYEFFPRCLQQTSGKLVGLDARLEESTKIYDVLLAFMSIPSMRPSVAAAILDTPVTEQRLTTPLVAIARTARLSFEEAINPEVPLKATRLLTLLLREAVDASRCLSDLLPRDRLITIIDISVKAPIQTSSDQVVSHCRRICEGLRLAEAASGDDSVRSALLDVLPAPFCAHLVETQLLSNPVGLHMGKPPAQRTEPIPEWSVDGVAVVMEILRLFAAFKDHSKPHKDQYWKCIKDDRLVPLLAFAISRCPPPMVHDALVLYTHCAQSHAFSSQLLSDLVASCTAEQQLITARSSSRAGSNALGSMEAGRPGSISREDDRNDRKRLSDDGSNFNGGNEDNTKSKTDSNGNGASQLDELIPRIKQCLDLKTAPKTSDVLAVYENKISMHQMRERELERLVAAKDAALQQSERLRLQFAASGSTTSDGDLARIRKLVTEAEQVKSDNDRLRGERDKAREEERDRRKQLEEATNLLAEVRKEKGLLLKEVEDERELTATLKKTLDEFRSKMEKMSHAVLQLQEQASSLAEEVERKKSEISKLNDEKKAKDKTIQEISREKDSYREQLDELQRNAEKSQMELEEKKRKMREEMMRLAGAF